VKLKIELTQTNFLKNLTHTILKSKQTIRETTETESIFLNVNLVNNDHYHHIIYQSHLENLQKSNIKVSTHPL